MPLRLAHPAWKAYRAGALPRVVFIEHLLALFKSLYEVHMRLVLKERGKLSKGACEFVLDSLWDVLQSFETGYTLSKIPCKRFQAQSQLQHPRR
ncbi:hypothetical protein CBOM_05614 [Ceraceosorus bombacis]|uniref:Uncharacterized protein n=1 Tax=Ceraceosorus bombacis TaxID=401625 RepID=A0A0N7LBB4_9BASI|nr:hypothetical protein CBOM_05614 [Ceraceosorus bombacis]